MMHLADTHFTMVAGSSYIVLSYYRVFDVFSDTRASKVHFSMFEQNFFESLTCLRNIRYKPINKSSAYWVWPLVITISVIIDQLIM